MRKIIFTSATFLLIVLSVFAQDGGFRYVIQGRSSRPVKKEELDKAKVISDFIPGYPSNWINDYVSVEILATCNGKAMKAVNTNDILSTEQKNILNNADLSGDIVVNVKYKYKNSVTGKIENYSMHVTMTLVPETEAEYVGGDQQMTKYFEQNAINKFSETYLPAWLAIPKEFPHGAVRFTVNEEGEIVNAKISKSSGNPDTDKMILEVIEKMPKWKPAKNSKGIKVKQEFEFGVGNDGC